MSMTPSATVLGLAVLLSLIIAFSQGIDYIARPLETAISLSIVEQKMALDFWGYIFLTFAGIAIVGNVFSLWPAAILGHGVLSFNYLAISIGVVWSLAKDWQGYGWNTGVIYLCLAAFHSLVADGCYDEWAREWRKSPPPIDTLNGEERNGQSDI